MEKAIIPMQSINIPWVASQLTRNKTNRYILVRVKGLEPPRLSPPEPKSGVSTNSTTPAHNTLSPVLLAKTPDDN